MATARLLRPLIARLRTGSLGCALAFGLPLLAAAWYVGDTFIEDCNFRTVSADLYRSGQLRSDEWRESHGEHGYRSVINLRGAGPGQDWYERETAFAAAHGLAHFDVGLSANHPPTVEQMRELVALMHAAPKPLLVHCKQGADRSGLVAALYRYAIEGVPPATAAGQLSLWYGHFPWLTSRTGAMDQALADFIEADRGTRASARDARAQMADARG